VLADSSSDCFIDDPMLHQDYLGDITGGHSLHPQSKFYDIIYSDQFKDLREYAKIANKYEIELLREDKRVNSCVDEVVTVYAESFVPIQKGLDSLQVFIELPNYASGYIDNPDWASTTIADSNIVLIDASGTVHSDVFAGLNVDGRYLHWIEGYSDTSIVDISGECFLSIISSNPIISSNTKLSIDLIGSPDNYPDKVKTRLASGVGINGVNPLLVNQDGSSSLPNNSVFHILSDKHLSGGIDIYQASSYGDNLTWHSALRTCGGVTNKYRSDLNTVNNPQDSFHLVFYTSNNAPYQTTDPKPVLEVTPKAIASNSHSIYKGGDIASQISGKITVGNGTNGYESKVLENAENLYFDFYVYADGEVFNY
jgi:hypothetical protein